MQQQKQPESFTFKVEEQKQSESLTFQVEDIIEWIHPAEIAEICVEYGKDYCEDCKAAKPCKVQVCSNCPMVRTCDIPLFTFKCMCRENCGSLLCSLCEEYNGRVYAECHFDTCSNPILMLHEEYIELESRDPVCYVCADAYCSICSQKVIECNSTDQRMDRSCYMCEKCEDRVFERVAKRRKLQ